MRGQKRGNISTLRPAHRSHFAGINYSFCDQRIHSAHHVPHIANAEIAHVECAKRRAVSRASAIVRLQNQRAAGKKNLHGIRVSRGRKSGTGYAGRSAMNADQHRISFCWVVIGGLVKNSFNRRAVFALPRNNFRAAQLPVLYLRGKVGQLFRSERIQRRNEKFAHVRRVFGDERGGSAILGERNIRKQKSVRSGDPANFRGCRIQAKDVAIGFLQRGEVDAVRAPIEQVRIFIELRGQIVNIGRTARRFGEHGGQINNCDVAVRIVEVRLREGSSEGQLLSIRRKYRRAIRPGERDDFSHGVILRELEKINILFAAECEQRVLRRAERNA